MPLTSQNIESELSYAYLHAVASKAGMSCKVGGRHDDNSGVDAIVNYFGPIPNTYISDVQIDIQLKATIDGGYDSIIYYTGTSNAMRDVNNGKVTDSLFMNAMFKKIKNGDLSMTIKPGGGADMLGNFQEVINLANLHEVDRRSVDSGDENEEKAFGFSTPPMVKDAMNGQSHPLKLNLPRDEPNSSNAVSNFPKASQLVVFISGDKDIYAYMGDDIRKGKEYTYQEFRDMLREKRTDKNFSVVIKPAASSSYKNTVDMLDEMTIGKIKHYALIDITKEEENYLHQIYQ